MAQKDHPVVQIRAAQNLPPPSSAGFLKLPSNPWLSFLSHFPKCFCQTYFFQTYSTLLQTYPLSSDDLPPNFQRKLDTTTISQSRRLKFMSLCGHLCFPSASVLPACPLPGGCPSQALPSLLCVFSSPPVWLLLLSCCPQLPPFSASDISSCTFPVLSAFLQFAFLSSLPSLLHRQYTPGFFPALAGAPFLFCALALP